VSDYLPGSVICAKGPVPYCLDEFSKGRGARARLQRLSNEIASLAPTYQGLENVFDTHLMSYVFADPRVREGVITHLRQHWFDASSPATFFPDHRVSRIYAEGVLKTLELSLKGKRTVVPISAWWIVDSPDVRMLTLADVDSQGATVGGRVTLLILTPRPPGAGESKTPILGSTAEAWVAEQQGAQHATYKINELRWGLSR
jgi:hypothetical protein